MNAKRRMLALRLLKCASCLIIGTLLGLGQAHAQTCGPTLVWVPNAGKSDAQGSASAVCSSLSQYNVVVGSTPSGAPAIVSKILTPSAGVPAFPQMQGQVGTCDETDIGTGTNGQ